MIVYLDREGRVNLASPTVTKWIEDGLRDPEGFWERAAQELPWFRAWDRVYEADPPTFRWFVGAQTNLAYNAVDRHVAEGNGGRAALIYLNERGDRVVLTYAQLLDEVKRLAAVGAIPWNLWVGLMFVVSTTSTSPS